MAEDLRSKITERFLGFFGNLKNDLTRSRIRSIQNPTSSTLSFQIKLLLLPLGGRMRRVYISPHATCQFLHNRSLLLRAPNNSIDHGPYFSGADKERGKAKTEKGFCVRRIGDGFFSNKEEEEWISRPCQ
jgi:hypothetical protein